MRKIFESAEIVRGSTWWRREWVYQQVLVAQKILLLFGLDCLDWEKLVPAVNTVYSVIHCFITQVRFGQINAFQDPADKVLWLGVNSTFAV